MATPLQLNMQFSGYGDLFIEGSPELPKSSWCQSDRNTPVPIPNTKVKTVSSDNTWWVTAWEDSPVPGVMKPTRDYLVGFRFAATFMRSGAHRWLEL